MPLFAISAGGGPAAPGEPQQPQEREEEAGTEPRRPSLGRRLRLLALGHQVIQQPAPTAALHRRPRRPALAREGEAAVFTAAAVSSSSAASIFASSSASTFASSFASSAGDTTSRRAPVAVEPHRLDGGPRSGGLGLGSDHARLGEHGVGPHLLELAAEAAAAEASRATFAPRRRLRLHVGRRARSRRRRGQRAATASTAAMTTAATATAAAAAQDHGPARRLEVGGGKHGE